MGRRAIEIDEDLLLQAMRAAQASTPDAAVELALRRLVDDAPRAAGPMLGREEALAMRGSGWEAKRGSGRARGS